MSYLGLQPNTPLLNTSTQFLSGNAVATQFTLSRSVASASDIDVMIGSTLKIPFTDYTAGNITLLFATPPASGSNNISVTYRAGALNSLNLSASVFNAGTVANPSVVSLAANNTGLYWANASSMSVTVSGTNRATFMANAISVSTDTGALIVDGGLGVDANVNIGGNVAIADATESTSVSTGAFKLSGGAGIVGNLNVGGDITCVGDFTVNGTFTTTGTDSLAVTDPFIFLAENNPGDTYDSGVVSQYFDGANTRYTGYFRDITDAKYKLFTNLLTQPTTTVDTTDPSFKLTDLVLSNLSATGNVTGTYFIGNGAALTGISTTSSNIFNSNTSVSIPAANGNINAVVNSTQIANIWSGGISVVGAVAASTTISATGNVTGGNVNTGGLISATGNITSAGNITGGNVLGGANVNATLHSGTTVSVTGNITGGNVIGGSIQTTGLMSATGDVYGNNVIATSNIQATLNVSASGNVTGGNILTGGIVSATGNVTGSYFIGNGSALTGISSNKIFNGTSEANIGTSGGNANISIGGTANVAVFSTLGANVTGWIGATGNLGVAGNVAFTGTTQNINIGTSQTTGNVTVGGTSQTGTIEIGLSTASQTINIGNGVTGTGNTKTIQIGENGAAGSTTIIDIGPITATTASGLVTFNTATRVAIANTGASALSVAGNITGANLLTGGSATATGNIVAGNVSTAGLITATGNVTGGNVITAGAVSAASVSASGTITGAGNITGGNISTGGLITATGNITGGNVSTAGLITATGNIAATGNVSGGNIIGTFIGNLTGTTVSVTGNITGGNLNAAGLSLSSNVVSALATTANITGGNLISTSVAQAANIIVSGAITTPNWTTTGVGIRTVASTYTDSSTAASGTAATNHVHVLAQPTIAATNSLVTTTTAATLYIAGAPANGTNMTVTTPWAFYVNAGNTFQGGNISVVGNVQGGNINTAGQVSATANITGGNISTAGLLTGANNIVINAPSPTPEGAQIVMAWANISGLTGQANSTWNIDVDNTANFRIFYQNATGVSAVPFTISPTTNAISMIGALSVNSGSAATAIVNGAANGVGNIGSSTTYFNTVFAKATSAQYADLAEWYEADADYPSGTVLIFGGSKEVTEAVGINDVRVAGVVSTNPAHVMNSGLKAPHVAAVALTGRVPTLVVGPVSKGDMMVTAGGGRAQACAEPRMGAVIGKALQDHPGGQGVIEIVVGRL